MQSDGVTYRNIASNGISETASPGDKQMSSPNNTSVNDKDESIDTDKLLNHTIDISKPSDSLKSALSHSSSSSISQKLVARLGLTRNRLISISCLFLLTIQNVAIALLMRYSRGILKERYMVSSNVMTGEAVKLMLTFLILLVFYENGSVGNTLKRVKHHMGLQTSLPLIVPALCYFCQNILSNKALDTLDAFTYQSLQQMRVLTTAAFAIILIGKRIVGTQWRALGLLILGLSLVLWKPAEDAPVVTPSDADAADSVQRKAAFVLGVFMVLTQSTLSGFAGVYFEAVLKSQGNNPVQRFFRAAAQAISSLFSSDSDQQANESSAQTSVPNLWDRNFQLASWSLILGIVILLLNIGDELTYTLENGYYNGWSVWTVAVCLTQSCGGLLIAMVVQYTDNIVKGFAMACAMCLSPIMSVQLFSEAVPNYPNIAGMMAVVLSCFNYSDIPAAPSAAPLQSLVDTNTGKPNTIVNGAQLGKVVANGHRTS